MAELKEKFVAAAKQAELNAVLMHRELAKYAKDNKVKEMFLEAAKDEGRHASILSKYTDAKLTAKDTQDKVLAAAEDLLPVPISLQRLLLKRLQIFEYNDIIFSVVSWKINMMY